MNRKHVLIFFAIGLLAMAALAARIGESYRGQTLGPGSDIDQRVFSEPSLHGQVNTHHLVDVPLFPSGQSTVQSDYKLPIVDTNSDYTPDSNALKGGLYELTDIVVTVDPRAFWNRLGKRLGGHRRLGLIVDVLTKDSAGQTINKRARLTWRDEFFASSTPTVYKGPGDIVPYWTSPLSDDDPINDEEMGAKVDIDSLDFEFDPVTINEHFETPILIVDSPDGAQSTVWYRVTFFQDLNGRGAKWVPMTEGVSVTFSGRYRDVVPLLPLPPTD